MSSPDHAFDAFVRVRGPALVRAAYLLTGDQHLAEDLVQSALSRTYRSWRRLDAAGNAEAYTRKIMYHLQVSWWRRRRVVELLGAAVPDYAVNQADEIHHAEVRLAVAEALGHLTAKQRAVLVLRFFEDQTERDTAEILGVSIGTVKVQTHRALDRIRAAAPELIGLSTMKEDSR